MPHDTPLIATIVTAISLAFALGALAHRLRISPIVGYLLAGVAIGPFTPGFVADQSLATELAEIGIILLMFGVGLHFSLSDLLSVRAIAVPGALVQIAFATALGVVLAWSFGWTLAAGLVFGLALSVASTVVLLRALQDRHLVTSEHGRIAVGWLIVEDLVMVLALVAIPALAPLLGADAAASAGGVAAANSASTGSIVATLLVTLLKVVAFFTLMMLIGRRVIPAILHSIAHTGSRELFRVGVLAIALGVAYGAAKLFGVSFALGAFLAGMILSESPLSQQAANESMPLKDAFAVLFFVSVGMLFNPSILIEDIGGVLATVGIIVVGKTLAALAIVRAFGYPLKTGVWVSASLAQIGEFSFILAGLGVQLGLMPAKGQELILAAALLSIMINPLLFIAVEWVEGRYLQPAQTAGTADQSAVAGAGSSGGGAVRATTLTGHSVVVGFGRVGSMVGAILVDQGDAIFVLDDNEQKAAKARALGAEARAANALAALDQANLAGARRLIVTLPSCFEAGQIVVQALELNPHLDIVALAQSDAEAQYLEAYGARKVVQGAREIAEAMIGREPSS